MKKLTALVLAAGAFSGGVYLSDDIAALRTAVQAPAAEGFFERPYDLRVVTMEDSGRVEAYLMDCRTKKYRPIKEGMQTSDDRLNVFKGFIKVYKLINML